MTPYGNVLSGSYSGPPQPLKPHPLIVIAESYPLARETLFRHGVEFNNTSDMFVPSSQDGAYMRLSAMLMTPRQVYFIRDWYRGIPAEEIYRTLKSRLARGGYRIDNCNHLW